MSGINNIFCIGRNYAKHATELGNEIPDSPILFSKPTHALASASGHTLTFQKGKGEIHHELEIVLLIDRPVKKGDKLEDVVSKMALGVDLTLRDIQSDLKKKGQPWLRAKGFKNSAIITDFWKFSGVEQCENFYLVNNGRVIQEGNVQDMIFDFQSIIDECEDVFGLGTGDIIFTGTPEGVGPISDGDVFKMYWGEEEKGQFQVSIN
ncbi:fumarylacetoacetate hydrolase family protein [Bacillus solitudinis]|uniref:fumarylacetoacetate hydrolase family protein n=1 Tax=Bacillus solitudinis TaxID=2014074 RepID=UPI000C23674D|nr:fumarylacetoacetate hydrolase family protein [Bacillus solitudinis]